MGRQFGAGLSAREVARLVREEWAETAEDILWRRTKLGLVLPQEAVAALARHLRQPTP
jgi:glycerol-3-phosphate dehydrogenase